MKPEVEVEVKPLITLQGICHECQRGYYYPSPTNPSDLRCAACGYGGQHER